MIKINLLPKGLNEKRIVRQLIVVFAILIVATATAGVMYKFKLDAAAAEMKTKADMAEAEKNRIAGINQQAQTEMGKIAPITAKVQFIKAIESYNTVMPALYMDLARYTYKGVQYRKVTPSSGGMTIEAYTPSLSDLGRYLLNMYKADSIFTSVAISAVPGYPASKGVSTVSSYGAPMGPMMYPGMAPGAMRYGGMEAVTSGVSKTIVEKGFNFTVNCTLKTPIAAPSGPGAAAAGAPGAAPGGMPGAMPGPSPMPGPAPAPGPAPGQM